MGLTTLQNTNIHVYTQSVSFPSINRPFTSEDATEATVGLVPAAKTVSNLIHQHECVTILK